MNGDDVMTPRERLVEVLLEEALRGRPAAGAPPLRTAGRLRWVAAAVVLLGVGVVVGTALLRPPVADGVAPAQEPRPQPPAGAQVLPGPYLADFHALPIATQAEWDDVMPRITAVNCWLLRAGARALNDGERGLATVRLTGAEATAVARLVPPVGADAFDAQRAEVPPFDAWLAFEVGEKRVHAFVRLHDQPTFVLGSRRAVSLPTDLLQELVTMAAAAGKRLQVARGVVSSLDELAEVPADAKAIRCPPPPSGSLQRHLGRFTHLEHLELVFGTFTTTLGAGEPISIQLPEVPTTLFDEMHVLPQLRHLRCNGVLLNHDDRIGELLALPRLTSLRLDGMDAGVPGATMGVRAGGVTKDGMRRLARRIEALELVGCELAPELLEPWIEAAQLRRLVLFGNALSPDLLARFARLPTLEDLGLSGVGWTDAHLKALTGSRLTRLRLGPTVVGVAGIQDLPHSLRLIDLRRVDPASPTLQVLLRRLRGEHPDCRILGPADLDPDDADPFAGLAGSRRW